MKPTESIFEDTTKNIAVIQLRYPYGKPQTFMSNSSLSLVARLRDAGYSAHHIDLNISFPELNVSPNRSIPAGKFGKFTQSIFEYQVICISVLGAPYIPSAIALTKHIKFWHPHIKLILGGQGVESLEYSEFNALFQGTDTFQVRNDTDLNCLLSTQIGIPDSSTTALKSAFAGLSTKDLRLYLSNEMCLFISQGCKYNCKFCAAKKNQSEAFRNMDCFKTDLEFLTESAKNFGITTLNFYASSLDFFQRPREIEKFLAVIAEIRNTSGVDICVRCLSCMKTFLFASKQIENFGEKLRDAGLWSVGFGVDGTDETIWKSQGKTQNSKHQVIECLDLAEKIGLTSELLMIFGFSEDTPKTLWKNLKNSIWYVLRYKNTVLRPYLAKEIVPGNEEWMLRKDVVSTILRDPKLFYNLDFCALGSKLTHPNLFHRLLSNTTYLIMIILFTPFGKCLTSPLLPQGSWGVVGKWFNKFVPFDK